MPAGATSAVNYALLSMLLLCRGLAGVLDCPPGLGHSEDDNGCLFCRPGTYADGASGRCVECPPGKWSSSTGAREASTCTDCPQGRWSNEAGSAWPTSCELCEPGRFGSMRGRTSSQDCAPCQPGTYNLLEGAVSRHSCKECPAGRFSSAFAAASEDHCAKCPPGKFGEAIGASSAESCTVCPAGTFQPRTAMDSAGACVPCEPGRFSFDEGSAKCRNCPEGSWSSTPFCTQCSMCPGGTWTRDTGAYTPQLCEACKVGSKLDCRGGTAVRVHLGIMGLNFSQLSAEARQRASFDYVHALAYTGQVDVQNVVDLNGNRGLATLTRLSSVEVYIGLPTSSTVNTLAARLYSPSFERSIRGITARVFGSKPSWVDIQVQPGLPGATPLDRTTGTSSNPPPLTSPVAPTLSSRTGGNTSLRQQPTTITTDPPAVTRSGDQAGADPPSTTRSKPKPLFSGFVRVWHAWWWLLLILACASLVLSVFACESCDSAEDAGRKVSTGSDSEEDTAGEYSES